VCEKCGHSVPRNAQRCTYCGQPFNGIKCPRCEFQGDAGLFSQGCPACGFAGDIDGISTKNNPGQHNKKPESDFGKKKKNKKMLPLFIYRIAGIIVFLLIVTIVILFVRYYL
jgi:uncharacterized membrane protein YvbJ